RVRTPPSTTSSPRRPAVTGAVTVEVGGGGAWGARCAGVRACEAATHAPAEASTTIPATAIASTRRRRPGRVDAVSSDARGPPAPSIRTPSVHPRRSAGRPTVAVQQPHRPVVGGVEHLVVRPPVRRPAALQLVDERVVESLGGPRQPGGLRALHLGHRGVP